MMQRINFIRSLSTTAVRRYAAAVLEPKQQYVDPEWDAAKPFSDIPKQSFLSAEFLPGGKLFKANLDDMQSYLLEKHGTIVRIPGILGRPEMVWTYRPEDFQKIYRTGGEWPFRPGFDTISYWKRQLRPDMFKEFHGLVDEQGETWKKYRTILNPVMMQPKTVAMYVPEIDSVARDFVYVTRKYRDQNSETPAEYGTYIQRYSLEAIAVIAFDTRLNVMEPKRNNKGTELARLSDRIFQLSYQLDFLPSVWKFVNTPTFNDLMKSLDSMTLIIKEYVDQAIDRIEAQKTPKPAELQSVLEKLLKIDRNIAVVMGFDMLAAGIDTTGSTIRSLFYLLARHPDKQAKLRAEVLAALPNANDALTAEKLNAMPYLRACMKEQSRMEPVTAGNVRKTDIDLVLQGYQIPSGTQVFLNHRLASNSAQNFARPDEYIPERWLKDDSHAQAAGCPHSKTAHPFTYMPFGFGSRACVGKRFAELEIAVVTARMIREFEMSWQYPAPKVESHFLRSFTGDFKLKLVDVK